MHRATRILINLSTETIKTFTKRVENVTAIQNMIVKKTSSKEADFKAQMEILQEDQDGKEEQWSKERLEMQNQIDKLTKKNEELMF
jgi:hypothetical protein